MTTDDLQKRLEKSLRVRLDATGSLEYALTWKHWDMRSGPRICALRARAHPTSDSASGGELGGWPTPSASKNTKNSKDPQRMKEGGVQSSLADAAWLAGWPTPDTNKRGGAQDPEKRKAGGHSVTLQDAATLAGWVTPASRDWKDTPGMA